VNPKHFVPLQRYFFSESKSSGIVEGGRKDLGKIENSY
jgi:hypothetical protein